MKEYIIKVNKNKIDIPSINLVKNDYNSTKFIFEFDFDKDYKKIFQMKLPSGVTWKKEIINNELILSDETNTEIVPILVEDGLYEFDIAIYDDNSKLTTTDKGYFTVRAEITGEDVELDDRVPILDDLINDTTKAVNEANNLDIDIITDENSTMVEITKKDGSKKTATVSGSGGIGTEKDPTVPEYVKNIKEQDITNWNNKATIKDMTDYIEEHKEELKGDKGDTGPRGEQGEVGPKGDRGEIGPQGPVGPQGETGLSGKDGSNGITPTIGDNGNWYLADVDTGKPSRGANGIDGKNGLDGYTPIKGKDYFDGEPGKDGYTPVKGTDYFTEADKQEMVNLVLEALPSSEEVDY